MFPENQKKKRRHGLIKEIRVSALQRDKEEE
jgi:hypothetical protein